MGVNLDKYSVMMQFVHKMGVFQDRHRGVGAVHP